MTTKILVTMCFVLGAAACGSSQSPAPAAQAPAEVATPETPAAAAPTPPTLRLPDTAAPTHYRAALTIVPAEKTFEGQIEIDLELAETTDLLWLNATKITVTDASLAVGETTIAATPVPGGEHFLGFRFAEAVGPGPARLTVRYTGELVRNEGEGVFVEETGGQPYQFTQFEALSARRAFPSFDEPRFKVPWQLSLTVKEEHVALSNTPVESTTPAEGGMKTVQFAETKPLPSYLIAFAVGPFDFHDAGKSRNGVPIRIVTPKGRAAEAKWSASVTADILAHLEDYFGRPYPYRKLDVLTIPDTVGFGAMEHPGLVTFNEALVLWKPEDATIGKQKAYGYIQAHELAHQWFGNLVTMPWWNDIWLNEAFASWTEGKVIEKQWPEWKPALSAVETRLDVMHADSLATARRIREPIRSEDDIHNAFDGITYSKGESVLRMFEAWVGPETFQKGIRAYMEKHAFGNATADDFLAAISEAAGRDVAGPFNTFLTQVGVPLVSFELSCAAGQPPTLALSQKRYLPVGSKASAEQVWQIPICVEYAAGGRSQSACTLLTEATGELVLEDAKRCPAWVLPNQDGVGYYHSHLAGELGEKLIRSDMKALSAAERLSTIGDFRALVGAGAAPAAEALSLVERLARSDSRHILEQSLSIVGSVDEMVPDAQRAAYEDFVRDVFGRRARALGWQPKKRESDERRELRPELLGLVADEGGHQRLRAEATRRARKWLDDRTGLHPSVRWTALGVAAAHGDRALFDRMVAEAKKEEDRQYRQGILGALGAFRDPEIARDAFALALTDDFDPRESASILLTAIGVPETRELAYQFVKDNYDAIAARLPEPYTASLPYMAVAFCDLEHRDDAKAFFTGRTTELEGGPRILEQVLESMALCHAYREAQKDSVVEFLKGR